MVLINLEDMQVQWMYPSLCHDDYPPEAWSFLNKLNTGFWYTPCYTLRDDPMSWVTYKRETRWLAEMEVYKDEALALYMELDVHHKVYTEGKMLLGSFLEYVGARERYFGDLFKKYKDINWSFKLPELNNQEKEELADFDRKMDRLVAELREKLVAGVLEILEKLDEGKDSKNVVPSRITNESNEHDDWEAELNKWEAKHNKWEAEYNEWKARFAKWKSFKEETTEDNDEALEELYHVMKKKRMNRVNAKRRYNVRGR